MLELNKDQAVGGFPPLLLNGNVPAPVAVAAPFPSPSLPAPPVPKLKEAVKFDGDKPRMELIDPEAMEELAKVLTFGAKKYEEHNWRKGLKVTRIIGATMRHLWALLRGETYDPETGLQHAAHAMCNCMFLIWTLKNRKECDDRFVFGEVSE